MAHECIQEGFLGQVKEFMENSKGLKTTMAMIAFAILLQVGTFLYLWGSLVTTVKNHDKNIDQILSKLDNIKTTGYAFAGEKGEKGKGFQNDTRR